MSAKQTRKTIGKVAALEKCPTTIDNFCFWTKSLSTNKLILIAPCAILSSRKNNGGKHGNDKAENMGNNG